MTTTRVAQKNQSYENLFMKFIDEAKQGRSESVVEAIENGSATDLQILLQKVCQDYHSIKKHDGHLQLVRYLLSEGAKPEREMVCEAARGGHELLIQALIEGGLPVDIFVDAALGNALAVQGHIKNAAPVVTDTDSHGMTPLHYCCASSVWRNKSKGGSHFLESSSILLSAGANVHAMGAYHGLAGITPLFYVAWTGGHPGIAHGLLEHGATITQNIFFAAVGHFQRHGDGNYEVAEVLFEHGFDINDCDERTALHAFASHEDSRGVSWLLDHGADVDAQDTEGNTPLMSAAQRNNGSKVLRLLVEAGSSLTKENRHGQTALAQAELNGKKVAVAYLSSLNK
jgi:ankyrin repeat protein